MAENLEQQKQRVCAQVGATGSHATFVASSASHVTS